MFSHKRVNRSWDCPQLCVINLYYNDTLIIIDIPYSHFYHKHPYIYCM